LLFFEQLCQHMARVAHVGGRISSAVRAETEAFGRLLWAPVQGWPTIAHGGRSMHTHITAPSR